MTTFVAARIYWPSALLTLLAYTASTA